MKELFQGFIAKRLATKLKDYSASELLRFYGSMRERVYAHSTMFLLGAFALCNYIYTYGFGQWALYLLLVTILLGLLTSVIYHIGVFTMVKGYLLIRMKPILDESERPESYFKSKIPVDDISITSLKVESVQLNSEPSGGTSE